MNNASSDSTLVEESSPARSKLNKPTLLTVAETAEYLSIPLPTVYYLLNRGQLPAVRIGKRWRIKQGLLDERYGLSETIEAEERVAESLLEAPEEESQEAEEHAIEPVAV